MFPQSIPADCDAEIILWRAQGVSLRDIAERLGQRGLKTSYMAVSRRLQQLNRPSTPIQLGQAALDALTLNLSDLDEVENRLRELEELAFEGDPQRGIAPNLTLTYRAITRRGEFILRKHRLLQAVLNSGAGGAVTPAVTEIVPPPVTRGPEAATPPVAEVVEPSVTEAVTPPVTEAVTEALRTAHPGSRWSPALPIKSGWEGPDTEPGMVDSAQDRSLRTQPVPARQRSE